MDYSGLTASEISAGIKSGIYDAAEVQTAALNLAQNIGQELNAFISCVDTSPELIDSNKNQLLRGVPVVIKDNICTRQLTTTCASKFLQNYVSPFNATVVENLLTNGAVIIGKTNMDEFAMGSSNENSGFGPVLNPCHKEYVPGGSSGGSAAAVASGVVPLAYGTDTGGSIRQPAAFCGIYGLKPTYGAVSRYGLVAFASSMDQIGPMARNVRDLALGYLAIAAYNPNDATSVKAVLPKLDDCLDTNDRFTIGLPKEFFTDTLDIQARGLIGISIDMLRSQGHKIKNISLPYTQYALPVYYILAGAEASANLARYDGIRFGVRTDTDDINELYYSSRSDGFGSEVRRRILVGTFVLSSGHYDRYYSKAAYVRKLITDDFNKAFEEVDMILTPTTPEAAFKLGEKINNPTVMYQSDIFTVSANLAGIPAVSVPCGKLPDGRPVGVQFMAPVFKEKRLFQIAAQCEETGVNDAIL